jgi:hypothetical protein
MRLDRQGRGVVLVVLRDRVVRGGAGEGPGGRKAEEEGEE